MIHGDRSQSQRTSALTGFQQGRFRVLVATDLASRGIHVQDIAHVINYDLPEVAENFIHRVGRTGRNGEHGLASTLFVKEQRSELFHLERSLGIKIERMRADETTSLPASGDRKPVNLPAIQERRPVNLPRIESAQVPERFVLPGEVFQTQMDN
jgi:ATP-dependent RNA helicase RhlE